MTSANHKLFGIHFGVTHSNELNAVLNVVYRTIHFFSEYKRYIYVISKPLHLLKTTRNCLNNSGSGKGTRFMWNGGLVLILNHVNEIFWKIRNMDYNSYPNLRMIIVYLTPYYVINVK